MKLEEAQQIKAQRSDLAEAVRITGDLGKALEMIRPKHPLFAQQGLQELAKSNATMFKSDKDAMGFLEKQATSIVDIYDEVKNDPRGGPEKALAMANALYSQSKALLASHTNINVQAKDKDGNPIFPDQLDEAGIERIRAFATGEGRNRRESSRKGQELSIAQKRENAEIDNSRKILKELGFDRAKLKNQEYVDFKNNPEYDKSFQKRVVEAALRKKYGESDTEFERFRRKWYGLIEDPAQIPPPPDGAVLVNE